MTNIEAPENSEHYGISTGDLKLQSFEKEDFIKNLYYQIKLRLQDSIKKFPNNTVNLAKLKVLIDFTDEEFSHAQIAKNAYSNKFQTIVDALALEIQTVLIVDLNSIASKRKLPTGESLVNFITRDKIENRQYKLELKTLVKTEKVEKRNQLRFCLTIKLDSEETFAIRKQREKTAEALTNSAQT